MLSDVNNIKKHDVKTKTLKKSSPKTDDPIMNEKHEKRKSYTTHYGPILCYIQSLKKKQEPKEEQKQEPKQEPKQEQRRSSTESELYSFGPSCTSSNESLDNTEQQEANKENDPHTKAYLRLRT